MQAWVQFGVPMEQLGPIFERLVENVQVKNLFRRERTLVLVSIIVRWQHLSKTKIGCYSRLEKLDSLLKTQQAISGTSTATYKMTEPSSALTKKCSRAEKPDDANFIPVSYRAHKPSFS